MRYKKWRYKINEYFTFTQRERNGVFVLSAILISLQIAILVFHFLPDPSPLKLDASTLKTISEFELSLKKKEAVSYRKTFLPYAKRDSFSTKKITELFKFDPNTLAAEGWQKLGFSDKQTKAIIKWRERSGKFHSLDEVKKVWVINGNKFQQLKPYIQITNADRNDTIKPVPKYANPFRYEKPKPVIIELNTADVAALLNLPFIADGRANAIIRYRDYLGGFISSSQLSEIKSLPDSILKIILPQIKIDASKIKLLNINTADLNGLHHPYLSKTIANMIINFRHEHGNYKTINDLRQLPLVDEELYRKIAPYLTVNL